MSAEGVVATGVESKIHDFTAEVARLLSKPCSWEGNPREVLAQTEQWCYEISNEALDELQNKLHYQHEKIADVRTLWQAVSDAKLKVSEAQHLIEESLMALSGTPDGGRMESLLEGVKSLDDHLTGDGQNLAVATYVGPRGGNPSQVDLSCQEMAIAENLLAVIGEVPSADSDMVTKISELRALCGKATTLSNELEQLRPGSSGIDEERLKSMGMLCSQLESSNSVLSEAALTAKLLSHMYEIEQIEEDLHATRSRHQMWEKRIGELRSELGSDKTWSEVDSPPETPDEPENGDHSTIIVCSKCNSENVVKNGFSGGKQRYRCKECKSRFTM